MKRTQKTLITLAMLASTQLACGSKTDTSAAAAANPPGTPGAAAVGAAVGAAANAAGANAAAAVVAKPHSTSGLEVGGTQSNSGNASLRKGFTPDPHPTNVTTGGSLDADSITGLPDGCRGFVTAKPDFILNYAEANALLRFYVNAPGDSTLIINDPKGNWTCNDDVASGNTNPMVDIRDATAGQYDIWVGSYRAAEQLRGTLMITELESNHPEGGGTGTESLQIGGTEANFGVKSLNGGFTPDPQDVSVTSGGSIAVSDVPNLPAGCRGHVSRKPDYIVNYDNPAALLRFYVTAQGNGDTTLLINDGAGHWHCDDDGGGGSNPMVTINSPPAGHYDIWIGSYSSGEQLSGTLSVTELESNRPGGGGRRGRGRRR